MTSQIALDTRKPDSKRIVLQRLVRRSSPSSVLPRATQANRSQFIDVCVYRMGMSLSEAQEYFVRKNHELWQRLCA
jgi:hypothetical protein